MRIGYLLPTREQIMEGCPDAAPLLKLAERAASLGFDSIWAGDSLLARPRHEPLTLLAAVAGRVPRVEIGTAVLLPALRNPVLLAHQVATLDQVAEGRLILGVGIAARRAEHPRRVRGCRRAVRKARRPHERRACAWRGRCGAASRSTGTGCGRSRAACSAPTPHRPGGPPIWVAGSLPASLERAAQALRRLDAECAATRRNGAGSGAR